MAAAQLLGGPQGYILVLDNYECQSVLFGHQFGNWKYWEKVEKWKKIKLKKKKLDNIFQYLFVTMGKY